MSSIRGNNANFGASFGLRRQPRVQAEEENDELMNFKTTQRDDDLVPETTPAMSAPSTRNRKSSPSR